MKFADITGHEREKQQLRQLVDSDKLPHALLISGPSGSGKLALGRALAQYVHCTNHTPDGDSCGICPACRQHQSHNNADLYFVFPVLKRDGLRYSDEYIDKWHRFLDEYKYADMSGWLSILDAGNSQPTIYADESNEIIRKLALSNYSARYKIMFIWLPERMQEAAANKLLKLIEEPWEDTKFILVSNEPQNILPTIFSRTQRINIKRLNESQVAQVVQVDCGLEEEDALRIAHLAEGDLNTAIALTAAGGETDEFRELFREIMRYAYKRDVRTLKEMADKLASEGREKNRRMLAYFSRQVRENFISNFRIPELNVMTSDEMQFSRNFAPFINAVNTPKLMDTIDKAANDIARNANAKIVLFDTFIQMIMALIQKPR